MGGELWALNYGNLKKVLKYALQYYEDHLGMDPSSFPVPDLQRIAKEADEDEMVKLIQLIIVLAVHCDQRDHYIHQITTLSPDAQQTLMTLIQEARRWWI